MEEERKKDNAVDRVNRAYNTYQNAKSLIRLGKAVRSARVVSALAATSEIWAPIAIALGLILFFTITIVVLTGEPGAASDNQTVKTTARPPLVYFCQGSSKFQIPTCKLGTYGCTPTSLAMILNAFGTNISPVDLSKNYLNSSGCISPTILSNYINNIKPLGYSIGPSLVVYDHSYGENGGSRINMVEAKKFIDNGYYIIAASGPYRCFPTNACQGGFIAGHEYVIEDVDLANNSLVIRDPNSCAYGSSTDIEKPDYNKRILIYSNFGSFFHAYPIKRSGSL